jgi:hypothetical protein
LSALARRSLLLSKKALQSHSRDLAKATPIL